MLSKYRMNGKVRVTFTLPPREGEEWVCVVGDFNGWEQQTTLMRRNEAGEWEVELNLMPGRKYYYRYLVNGHIWRYDPAADARICNPHGADYLLVSTVTARRTQRAARR